MSDPEDEGLESLPMSDELEAALREAEESADARAQEKAAQESGGGVGGRNLCGS